MEVQSDCDMRTACSATLHLPVLQFEASIAKGFFRICGAVIGGTLGDKDCLAWPNCIPIQDSLTDPPSRPCHILFMFVRLAPC